jgi:hypothetical protein
MIDAGRFADSPRASPDTTSTPGSVTKVALRCTEGTGQHGSNASL